jgi:hypothetical protein
VAFAHFGQRADMILELAQCDLGLALEAHHGEDGDPEPQLRAIEIGMVATNHACVLERAHAAQAGRRGQPHALRQLDIGDPPLALQLGQQAPIDPV